jgi:hypothetical protein
MKKYTRILMAAGALVALGTLTACSGGSPQVASPTSAQVGSPTGVSTNAATPMPSSATFIADMPEKDGTTMTMAIAVEGEKVVAYMTNGSNDEAYFVGTQKDGRMDLMSMYGDDVKASFDGKSVGGTVTMNETGSAPVKFAARAVSAPAGIYTAAHDNVRATWVVRPDHTMTGVMDNHAPGDHKVTDAIMLRDQAFKNQVRQMRANRQLQQAPPMSYGTWSMRMGNDTMAAVRVTGDMSL